MRSQAKTILSVALFCHLLVNSAQAQNCTESLGELKAPPTSQLVLEPTEIISPRETTAAEKDEAFNALFKATQDPKQYQLEQVRFATLSGKTETTWYIKYPLVLTNIKTENDRIISVIPVVAIIPQQDGKPGSTAITLIFDEYKMFEDLESSPLASIKISFVEAVRNHRIVAKPFAVIKNGTSIAAKGIETTDVVQGREMAEKILSEVFSKMPQAKSETAVTTQNP